MRPYKQQDKGYYFKMHNGVNISLIRYTFEDNGFREVSDRDSEWSVLWSISTIKSSVYQALTRNQKVNHFPKSHAMTRKDSMYRHLATLKQAFGEKHFKFLPDTFILPNEAVKLYE